MTKISSLGDWADDETIKNENIGVDLEGRTNAFHLKPMGQSDWWGWGDAYFLGIANCFPLTRIQGETSHFHVIQLVSFINFKVTRPFTEHKEGESLSLLPPTCPT